MSEVESPDDTSAEGSDTPGLSVGVERYTLRSSESLLWTASDEPGPRRSEGTSAHSVLVEGRLQSQAGTPCCSASDAVRAGAGRIVDGVMIDDAVDVDVNVVGFTMSGESNVFQVFSECGGKPAYSHHWSSLEVGAKSSSKAASISKVVGSKGAAHEDPLSDLVQ